MNILLGKNIFINHYNSQSDNGNMSALLVSMCMVIYDVIGRLVGWET